MQHPLSRRVFLRGLEGAALGLALPGLGACSRTSTEDARQEPCKDTLFLFDTVCTLEAYCDDALFQQVCERAEYFEAILDPYVEDSDVWRINGAAGAPVAVSAETCELVDEALGYCAESGGLFDITIGAVSLLWDFDQGVKPDDTAIAEAVTHVDYTRVIVDRDALSVTLEDPQAKLDLGGIAKGFVADDLARMLREGGCESACLNLGGNVSVVGTKPDGSDWNIGIQDPNGTHSVDASAGDVVATIRVHDASVVTSGLYERTFDEDGVSYYHILDPATGYPAQTDLLASSVACGRSTRADACSTTLFLLGRDGALEFVEAREGLEGLVIDTDGNVDTSSGSTFELR